MRGRPTIDILFNYKAHAISLFSQFDFALNQVSRLNIEKFLINNYGFTLMFVITRSLAN